MKSLAGVREFLIVVVFLLLSLLPASAQLSSVEIKPGINLVAIPLEMSYSEFNQNYGDKIVFIGTYYTKADGKLSLESSTPDIVPGKAYLIIAKQSFSIFGQLTPIEAEGGRVTTSAYDIELYKVGEAVNATSNETITLTFNITENGFTQTIETSIPSDYEGQYLALKVKDLMGNELYTYYFTAQNNGNYTVTIPSEKARETVLVTGTVKDANTGEPLQGAKVCVNGESDKCSLTDNDGIFKLTYLEGMEIKLDAELQGYTTNQKVVITSANPVTIELKPLTVRAKITLDEGATLRALGRTRVLRLNDDKVVVSAPDNSLSITVSKSALSRALLRRGDGSKTYVLGATLCDPSSEKAVFPGRFVANDPKSFGERSNGNATGEIESVAFMDLNLYDENGNRVNLPVDGMTIRFKIPESLQAKYREAYNRGETTIPWYSYNGTTGLWQREGDVRLIEINGELYGEAKATHFSWWNVDRPVTEHACLMVCVEDRNGNPVNGARVIAEGITYQGMSSPRFTGADGYITRELRVKRGSRVKVVASYEGVKAEQTVQVEDIPCPYNPSEEQIQKPPELNCMKLFIVRVSGTVYDNSTNEPLEGVQVYSSTGASAITGKDGKFSFEVTPDQTVVLKASYVKGGITYIASRTVPVLEEDVDDADIYIDTNPVCVSGTVYLDNGTGVQVIAQPLGTAKVIATNGYVGETNSTDGTYRVCTRKNYGNLDVTFKYFDPDLSAWYAAEKTFYMGTEDLTNEDVTIKVRKTKLTGCVKDTEGHPVTGAFVTTSTGVTTTTDASGNFELTVPANAKMRLYAIYNFVTAGIEAENSTTVVSGDPDTVTPLECLTLNIEPAYLKGRTVVVRGSSNYPLAGVKIMTSYGFVTYTNSTGEFKVPVRPDSNVRLIALFNGITKEEVVDAPAAGETKDIGDIEFSTAEATLPPVLLKAEVKPKVVKTGEDYVITAVYRDIDSDNLMGTCPDGTQKTLSENGSEFTLTCNQTAENQVGVYRKELRVRDDQGHEVVTHVSVDVQEDLPPGIISLTVSPERVKVGTAEPVKASVLAYSPDNDELNYVWFLDGSAIDSCNGSANCDVDVSGLGTGVHNINVKVIERTPNGKYAEKSKGIEVVNNIPPGVKSFAVSPQRVIVPGTVTASVEAEDSDGSIVGYTWYLDNSELKDCENSTDCSVDLSENDTGSHTFRVVVTDNDNGTVTASAGFVAIRNNCPVIDSLLVSKTTVIPGETVTLMAVAEDADGDELTYSWIIGNEKLSGRTVQWEAPESEGSYNVELLVSDGICVSRESSVITVSQLRLIINADKTVVTVGNETAHLSYSVAPQGYSVTNATWELVSKPQGSSASLIASGSGVSITPDVEGTYTVKLTAYYGSERLTSVINITAVNPGELKTVKGQAVDDNGNPIPGAVVELYDKDDRTRFDEKTVTDSNGNFTFTGVPPGKYYLVIKVDGYEIYSQEVDLE